MRLHGSELLLHIFGLVGEDVVGILRLNELLGVIERRLQIRFGEAERLRADVLGARLQGGCGAFRLRGCLVSGLNKTSEGLAGLLDALRGQVTDFGGDFVGDLAHSLDLSLKFEARRRTEFAAEPSHCWRWLYRLAVGGRQRCDNVSSAL